MNAVNNIIYTAGLEPLIRYAKTVEFSLSGTRLNPHDAKERLTFILADRINNEFDYEREVVEIYSEIEKRFFVQTNAYLFREGLIAEYTDGGIKVDMTNVLTDEEVESLAGTRLFANLKPKLDALTSKVPLNRVLEAAIEMDRPRRFIDQLTAYIESR